MSTKASVWLGRGIKIQKEVVPCVLFFCDVTNGSQTASNVEPGSHYFGEAVKVFAFFCCRCFLSWILSLTLVFPAGIIAAATDAAASAATIATATATAITTSTATSYVFPLIFFFALSLQLPFFS